MEHKRPPIDAEAIGLMRREIILEDLRLMSAQLKGNRKARRVAKARKRKKRKET